MMTDLADQRQALLQRIGQAVTAAGRPDTGDAATVMLLAVSKTRSVAEILSLYRAGQIAFGENYLQEALSKQALIRQQVDSGGLAGLPPLQWHFIGHVQRNKTRDLAAHFDWVHGVDRLIVAQRLSQQRGDQPEREALNVCLQVNIDRQPSKDGCLPEAVMLLTEQISGLPHLHLRGLMVIPDPAASPAAAFARTRDLFEQARGRHQQPQHWDTLSMGMSDDLEMAIAAGSTLVRVGTALFGPRPARAAASDPDPVAG